MISFCVIRGEDSSRPGSRTSQGRKTETLLLGFRVGANMRHDDFAHRVRGNESPMPSRGRAVSLAITVKLFRPCRTSSTMIRCGIPTPKNPPIMTEAPSGIFLAAADKAIVLCICLVRFAVGERQCHVHNEQHDQNAKCDVIGNCHSGASGFGC